jgi:tetratricopeptide (TPR) repeat protein
VYDILLSVAEDMHYDYSRVGMSVTFAGGPALLGVCDDYSSLLIQRLREANIAGVSAITKVTGYPDHVWVTLQYNGKLLYLDPTWFDTDDIDEDVRMARPLYRDARQMTFDNAIFTNYGEHHIPGILFKEDDYDHAIAVYTGAIRLNPNDAIVYLYRGYVYYHKGDYDRAIADYTEAIRLDPNDAIVYLYRGYAYNLKGDYDRAIADFTEAIRLDPNAIAYTARGCAYGEKGDNDRAIADYTEAIRLDPDYAIAYANRGITHKQLGQIDQAIQDFESALYLDPNLEVPRRELQEIRGN